MSDLRALPSVDALLQTESAERMIAIYGRGMTVEALRTSLAAARQAAAQGDAVPDQDTLLAHSETILRAWFKPTLVEVINASGVVLHTNLGRAPLSREALRVLGRVSSGYCTLEYDLERGSRGSRAVHAEGLLKRLTGAEAALVVNNNAAAVLLTLSALARRKRAVISRTQLVEIGGGFRIPDVMAQSGAKLVEIGTTNRVHLADYEAALAEGAALVLRAHPSNFRIIGFTSEPELAEIARVTHAHGALLMDDLGSGTLLDTAQYGLPHEPTVQESLAAGADVVTFSGDKLLGGPQAGIILGKAELIAKIKKHPLARAVRADKLCLAALAVTLEHYLKGEAERKIPIWRMISQTPESLRARAQSWAEILGTGEVIPGLSTVGGGSLPQETLPTFLLALKGAQPNALLAKMRRGTPPVVARVEADCAVLDPRTVLPEQDEALVEALKSVMRGS